MALCGVVAVAGILPVSPAGTSRHYRGTTTKVCPVVEPFSLGHPLTLRGAMVHRPPPPPPPSLKKAFQMKLPD